MQAHHIAGRLVQNEVDVVERNDAGQPLCEIVKEFVQVPM
jgi:hypothetical protein